MEKGWIIIERKIRDNWIWRDPVKLRWWIDILMEVNHTEKKVPIGYKIFTCKRGECIMSLLNWGKRWGVSKTVVNNFFTMLENDNMIKTINETVTTRLIVCNYESYQKTQNGFKTDLKPIENGREPQQSTTNEFNNDNTLINNEKEKGKSSPSQISKRFLLQISEVEDFLKSDEVWKEIVCMQNNCSIGDLENNISDFTKILKSRGEVEKSPSDAKSHFVNWYNIQKGKVKTNIESKQGNPNSREEQLISEYNEVLRENKA